MPKAEAPDVGGGGGADARRRDGLPHADGLDAAQRARRTTSSSSGAAPAASARWRSRSCKRARRHPDRRRLQRGEGRVLQAARRAGLHQPQGLRPLGHAARTGRTTSSTTSGSRARAPSARRSGTRSASAAARASSSSTPARTRSRRRSSSATPAAWSSSAPARPATTPSSTCATSGCARSGCQGSHFANDEQANGFNDLVVAGKIDPCLARVFPFEEVGLSHQLMHEGQEPRRQHGDPRRRPARGPDDAGVAAGRRRCCPSSRARPTSRTLCSCGTPSLAIRSMSRRSPKSSRSAASTAGRSNAIRRSSPAT